jgi:hypothetical protein
MQRGKTYRSREVVHEATIKDGPATIEITDPFDQAAVDGNKSALRVDVGHNGPDKRVINVRKVSREDRHHGPDVVEMYS